MTSKFFVVTYVHPDGDGWNTHLQAHVDYLNELLEAGILRASGPFPGTAQRSAMLILTAKSRDDILQLIDKDPYRVHSLVTEMTVTEWDPIFGTYHDESGRKRPD